MANCCSKNFFKEITSLFKALGDQNRMALFERLCSKKGKNSVKELSTCCDLDLSVVSRHLAHLKKAGALNARKDGREVLYEVNGKELAANLRALADYIESLDK
jgi:ArsR family transcriptional regulator